MEPPAAEDIVVVTGPTRVRGILAALDAGVRPTVVAPEPVFDWLVRHGVNDGGPVPRSIDGVGFDAMNYAPAHARVTDRLRGAMRRLRERERPPACEPQILELTFPDHLRLVHLDLSLHAGVDEAWVTRAAARFGNPDLLLLGLPHGEGSAVLRLLPRFGPNRVLLAEMTNDERREAGLPTELVTPTRDELVRHGLDVHVFATQASFRFE